MVKYRKLILFPVLFLVVTAFYATGFLNAPDYFLQDTLYRSLRPADPRVFVIGIDEETLDHYGPWGSWSRQVTADLIQYLNQDAASKPAAIGIDIMFFGNTTDRADRALVQAVEEGGNVVLASQVVFAKELQRTENATSWNYGGVRKYEEPFDALATVSRYGIMNVLSNSDGIVRNSLQWAEVDGERKNSFAQEIYRLYAERTQQAEPLHTPPVTARGEWYIPFAGKPGEYYGTAGKGTSWLRVMNGEIPRELFRDAIVLIGPYSTGMMDSYFTSASRNVPMHGVEVHANILQALLDGNFKRYAPGAAEFLIAGILAAVFYFLFLRLPPRRAALLAFGACALYVAGAWLLFQAGWILTLVYPLLLLLLSYLLALIVNYILITAERAALYEQMRRLFMNSIRTIANTVDAKDPCTSGHCRRVAKYALMIGHSLGFSESDLDDLEYTAILHDVGKIGVADSILKKDGPLTDEEYAEMKTHPVRGAMILDEIKEFKNHITDGTRYHHERYDGKGYSEGLKGEEIPLFARVIAVADAYDAMTQNRPYRNRMPRAKAVEELQRGSGTQFDPVVVAQFIALLQAQPSAAYELSPDEEAGFDLREGAPRKLREDELRETPK